MTLETDDGYQYRFQRFGADEPLTFYEREKANGEDFQRRAPLPEHVEAVRDAIQAGELTVIERDLLDALVAVGAREAGAERPQAGDDLGGLAATKVRLTDGGVEETDEEGDDG